MGVISVGSNPDVMTEITWKIKNPLTGKDNGFSERI